MANYKRRPKCKKSVSMSRTSGMSGMNKVKKIRESRLISKAELARKAGVSVLTIQRVENGLSCRLDTKRKIIEALGFSLKERGLVFDDEETFG